MKIIHSYKEFYKKNGLIKTVLKIVSKPFRFIDKKIAYRNFIKSRNKIFDHKSIKDRFSYIYSAHYWPSNESVSGPGSELKNTKNIREEIKKIIEQYKIKKFLDIPCGDFTWIQSVINDNIIYVGGDIVTELISENKKKNSRSNVNFINIDLLKDKLPNADLMLCRDCLVHLSNKNVKKFLKNFVNSDIKYILVTSYESSLNNNNFNINIEIDDGDFRPTYLRESPFNFPNPTIKILDKDIEHSKNPNLKCYLYLYSKNQLKQLIEN